MQLADILKLQGTLFALMLTGAFLRKKGILDNTAKKYLTDLCTNIVIPCNIFKSCLMDFDMQILKTCGLLLAAGIAMQLLCLLLNRFAFNRYALQRKKVLQYCTIVPMSGFLGIPIAEGLYSGLGVLYTAIYLMPMRIVMWSVGTTYFIANAVTDKKKLIRNVLTHPCLVANYLGIFCMVTQLPLPEIITRPVQHISACTTALTMFIVGMLLTDVKLTTIINRDTIMFSVFRLIVLPALALAIGLLLNLDHVSLGVSVLMTGMPAGATAAMFASRYNSDAVFATKCVVMTTLVSMVTLPVWCLLLA